MKTWDASAVRLEARRLRTQLRVAGAKRRIAYICHPAFLPYVEHLHADRVVYHVYDLFDCQPGWNAELDAAERTLLRRADLVFGPSQALVDELLQKVNRPIQVLLNAADVPTFLRAARAQVPDPADLAPVPHPRIGYVGSLHPQVDYALIRALAVRRSNYHWVLIGPKLREKDLLADPDYLALQKMSNVHILDAKRHDEMPGYTVNMDVNVMVYKETQTSWTRVAYPLKLHEYLGSGKPVITMNLPMLRPLADVIRFAHGADDWIEALDDAIANGGTGTPALRQSAAAEHSWDARAHQLEGWLGDITGISHASSAPPVRVPASA